MKIIRVVFFIEQTAPSRFYEAYLKEFLSDPGIEFYVFNLKENQELNDQLRPYVKAFYSLKDYPKYWKGFRYIVKTLNTIQPDIIHAQETIPSFYAAVSNLFVKKRARVFYHRHHSFYHNYKKRIMDQVAFLFCKKVICVSEFSKSQAAREHPLLKRKLERVYNGVRVDDVKESSDFRLEKMAVSNDFKILFLARLKPRKGHLLSIDIIKKVTALVPAVKLYIAGEGELKDSIAAYISKQEVGNSVELMGPVDNIKRLLHLSDMVILPSESEAFSLTVLETLSEGRLLLASDLPSIREIIVNRKTGVLINPYDEKDWTENILYFISNKNEAEAIAKNGQSLFENHFTMPVMAGHMKQLYQSVAH